MLDFAMPGRTARTALDGVWTAPAEGQPAVTMRLLDALDGLDGYFPSFMEREGNRGWAGRRGSAPHRERKKVRQNAVQAVHRPMRRQFVPPKRSHDPGPDEGLTSELSRNTDPT